MSGSANIAASTGLNLRVDVRDEYPPGRYDDEDRDTFIDLVLVGGGTSVTIKSWQTYDRWRYVGPSGDPADLVKFAAEKLAELIR